MYFLDQSLNDDKIVTAIGTGGILIVAGDLMRSPYGLSSSLTRAYSDLAYAYVILESVTYGENEKKWTTSKIEETTVKCGIFAANAEKETAMLYIGIFLTILGFSSLLLVFASEQFYSWVSSVQPLFTIVSFLFLVVSMSIKEHGEHSVEDILREKEQIESMIELKSQQEDKTQENDI